MLKHLGQDKKPFLLSYTAFKEFERIQSKSKDVDMHELFAYCGFKSGHAKEKKEFKAKPEEMADWFDDDISLFAEVMEELAEALPRYQESQKKIVLVWSKLKGEKILEEQAQDQKALPGKKSKK